MKSLIIIQDTDLETLHEQTMDYLQAKYHTYPYVFERIPDGEIELEFLASIDSVSAETDNVSAANSNIPIGKLVI